MIAMGLMLQDEDKANLLIMQCADMAYYLSILEDATGLLIVEPSQATVNLALGQVALNLSHKSRSKVHAG